MKIQFNMKTQKEFNFLSIILLLNGKHIIILKKKYIKRLINGHKQNNLSSKFYFH